jgi:PIN domain nuclease of toxin-antitoxin system
MSADSPELTGPVRQIILNPDNKIFLSAASSWEIGVKYALGKLPLPANPSVLIPSLRQSQGIPSLPITEADTLMVSKLPLLHRDPFDRILVAQALNESLTILTPDNDIGQYPVRVFW